MKAVQKLLTDRDQLLRNYAQRADDETRIQINKINADIKRLFIDSKRSRWEQLCSKLDYKIRNSRLWKLAKALYRVQPKEDNSNSVTKSNGSPTIDDKEAAEELVKFYSKESRLTFNKEDRKVGKLTKNLVKTCRKVSISNHLFSDHITTSELIYVIQELIIKTLLDPTTFTDNFWKTLDHMVESAFCTFLICRGRRVLPEQWKTAVILPVRKPNKDASSV
ncbi:hypothetical protein AVEN_122052-1 [Araneus ventricosus]|uniref:Uncharacterized protein n=1 Tax=Araneus ventricosus TaxID=182803 RepID=A0A4Y2F1J5_ARAVE|nr:hypothetical protein AVEN_122052-1 [Araneus ventricosus]